MQITGKFTRNKDISARLNREVEQRKFVYLHAVCDRAYNAVPVIYSSSVLQGLHTGNLGFLWHLTGRFLKLTYFGKHYLF